MTGSANEYWKGGALPLVAPERLGEIVASAADISLVVSLKGRVLAVMANPAHRSAGQLVDWEGQDIRDLLAPDSRPKIEARLQRLQAGEEVSTPIELNHACQEEWAFPVSYSIHRLGEDGSALLMLGRDLRPLAEMQFQLIEAQIALERDYEAQREYDTRYRVLMEATRDGFVVISAGSGRIIDANGAAAALLGAPRGDLLGASFAQEFEGLSGNDFIERLAAGTQGAMPFPQGLEARRTGQRLRLVPTVFRAAGERLVATRIEPIEPREGQGIDLGAMLSGLYRQGADAMVFTDREGVILSVNESFLSLLDVAQGASVKGRALSEFLVRGSVDLRVLIDNAVRSGRMRLFATRMTSEHGAQVPVEIAASYLADPAAAAIAFVIRDASRAEVVRRPGVPVSDDAMRSVMELVGSASLKDIVTETTDVVEKMCIETAVELTRNNRVAAAEMLGLSRQSLYVKLRKYGLLHRNGGEG